MDKHLPMILEKIESFRKYYNYQGVIEVIEELPENEFSDEIILHYFRALNYMNNYKKNIKVLKKYDHLNTKVEWQYYNAYAYYALAKDKYSDSGELKVLEKAEELLKSSDEYFKLACSIDAQHEETIELKADLIPLIINVNKHKNDFIKYENADYSTLNSKEKGELLLHELRVVRHYISAEEITKLELFKKLKGESIDDKKLIIAELLKSVDTETGTYQDSTNVIKTITGLIRSNLKYNETEWMFVFSKYLEIHKSNPRMIDISGFPLNYTIQQIERYLKNSEPSDELITFISETVQSPSFSEENKGYYGGDIKKSKKKLLDILSDYGIHDAFKLADSDIGPFVNKIIEDLTDNTEQFSAIFILASEASQSKPTAKFQKLVKENIDLIGKDSYRKFGQAVLEIALSKEAKPENEDYIEFCSANQQFIKGMVWTMERFSDKETISLLSRLFQKSYEKIPGYGPAAASLGNACAYTLGNMRGKDGLGALSRIKLKLKQNNIRKMIDTYLTEGAKKYNVSVEELKEMAVPSYKLEKGVKTVEFDDYQLQLKIEGAKVVQQWVKPDGSAMKSVPSHVKNSTSLSNLLKEIRKEVKEIQKVFSAQKQRIDNQFILDRIWSFDSFKKYYVDHGLVYPVTQKLIWTFTKGNQSANAILLEDKWYSVDHDLIDWIDDETQVKLWHPVNADEQTIIAWREKMMDLEWKQPLKQAFRELYILTDAEINTKSYSNRMAAHILKQHQFSMLASLRGWKYSLMGSYDDGIDNEVCQKYLPEHKITAEYWIDELNDYEAFNDAGIWLYISTDQVKFKNEQGEVMDLVDVPKMVFTEIMRDVDLFVGVASVGNDPQWMDNNGERQENRNYWESYSFGNLTEIAKTRKTILERLLPRLTKLKNKAHIDGKFLFVKGEFRTYKIHIGSGNILMEPNDQYLCIVPSRSADKASEKVFIPFEGDKGLSIVLSKAFLLAEDTKITDSTITSQINRN